ncbi:m7GpppN-mRNA hydrolase-like [Convolutriloba macropyga]|uniref:m7GpppN-mRNA hydrolase-like n=1 Tax=Convolutriloba macropyga TaxID=536237 RepID=UPI003F5262F0
MPQPVNNYTTVISADVLNDLCSRFIVSHDSTPSTKLCYQLELAYWFYIDFERPDNSSLPSVSFSEFAYHVLSHVASLKHLASNVDVLVKEWRQFKSQVPTYGCIILDSSFKFCLLVHGFSSSNSWSFPKGKVNEGESPQQCALREVEEEVGVDFTDKLLPDHYIDKELTGRKTRLYFVTDVPFKTQFSPKCRGEIRDIRWFPIDSLPRHKSDTVCQHVLGMQSVQFFMVIPFVEDILNWVSKRTPLKGVARSANTNSPSSRKQIQSTSSDPHYDNIKSSSSSKTKLLNRVDYPSNGSKSPLRDKETPSKPTRSDSFYENLKAKPQPLNNKASTGIKKENDYSNNSQFVPTQARSASVTVSPKSEAYNQFKSEAMLHFKVDVKRVMMAWDGWP